MLAAHSEVFDNMFRLPKLGGNNPSTREGLSDDSPIIIPEIEADQFRHLLLLFYGMLVFLSYFPVVIHSYPP